MSISVSWRGPAAAGLYGLLWLATLLVWILALGKPAGEVVVTGVILGLVFPAAAFVTTLGMERPEARAPVGEREIALTISMVVLIGLYLIGGPGYLLGLLFDGVVGEAWIKLADKLLVFVLVPALLLGLFFGRRGEDFGVRRPRWSLRSLLIFVVVTGLFAVLQLVLGSGGSAFLEAAAKPSALWGLPVALLWLVIEAGVVEEFFFRAVVQERIAVATRSPWLGVFAGGLVFALAHVPGLVLRSGAEGWGVALAHAVLVLAPASFTFAVLWMRTRNLWLLAAIHGAADLVPNYASVMESLGWPVG